MQQDPVRICCGERRWDINAAALSSASGFFRALLDVSDAGGCFPDSGTRSVPLDDADPAAMDILLRFVETGGARPALAPESIPLMARAYALAEQFAFSGFADSVRAAVFRLAPEDIAAFCVEARDEALLDEAIHFLLARIPPSNAVPLLEVHAEPDALLAHAAEACARVEDPVTVARAFSCFWDRAALGELKERLARFAREACPWFGAAFPGHEDILACLGDEFAAPPIAEASAEQQLAFSRILCDGPLRPLATDAVHRFCDFVPHLELLRESGWPFSSARCERVGAAEMSSVTSAKFIAIWFAKGDVHGVFFLLDCKPIATGLTFAMCTADRLVAVVNGSRRVYDHGIPVGFCAAESGDVVYGAEIVKIFCPNEAEITMIAECPRTECPCDCADEECECCICAGQCTCASVDCSMEMKNTDHPGAGELFRAGRGNFGCFVVH